MGRLILKILLLLIISTGAFGKGAHKISKPSNTSLSVKESDVDRLMLSVENDSYSYNSTEYLAPTLMYSTKSWDIGLSSQNILVSGPGGAQNFENDSYFNLSKTFKYKDLLKPYSKVWSKRLSSFSTTFGTQTGLVFPLSTSNDPGKINNNTVHKFYFIDTDIEIVRNRLSIHGGPYWTNAALSTTTSYTGWQTGFEAIIFPKTLRVSVDSFSGHSNVSGTVIQATYSFSKNVEFFIGEGIPTSNSGNHTYSIFGINLIRFFNYY